MKTRIEIAKSLVQDDPSLLTFERLGALLMRIDRHAEERPPQETEKLAAVQKRADCVERLVSKFPFFLSEKHLGDLVHLTSACPELNFEQSTYDSEFYESINFATEIAMNLVTQDPGLLSILTRQGAV